MTRDVEHDGAGPQVPSRPVLRLRPAGVSDAPALLAVSLRAIRGSAAGHYSPAQLEAWAATRSVEGHRRHVLDARTFVVVDEGDAVVGFVTLLPVPDEPALEVDQLFVDPRAGGRGAARLLLAAAADAARSDGHRRMVTHASWRAVPVFEHCGYRRVRTETVRVGEQVLTRALMVADLPVGGSPGGEAVGPPVRRSPSQDVSPASAPFGPVPLR